VLQVIAGGTLEPSLNQIDFDEPTAIAKHVRAARRFKKALAAA
jgi:hypothetical protein